MTPGRYVARTAGKETPQHGDVNWGVLRVFIPQDAYVIAL
jgi:hypothetical protein